MINLIDWADYLTVAVFAKAATYLAEAEGDKYTLGEPVKETLDILDGGEPEAEALRQSIADALREAYNAGLEKVRAEELNDALRELRALEWILGLGIVVTRYGGLIVLPPPDDQQKEQLFNSYAAVAKSLGWTEKNHG